MTEFLNTEKLLLHIPEIIKNAKEELIIVVPFISLSKAVSKALKEADEKGVEVTIICRYDEVNSRDVTFLENLKNLNIFSHPNVHSKCYFNGDKIVITSLNLTAHSEKNNREMGVCVSRYECWDGDYEFDEDYDEIEENDDYIEFADDLKMELQNLLNGSDFVLKSKRTNSDAFNCSLLDTEQDRIEKLCEALNNKFSPKRFYIEDQENSDYITCENYHDKLDLRIKDIEGRIEFEPNKGGVTIWKSKLKVLNEKTFSIESKGKKYEFKFYLNKGAKLNIVGDYEEMSIEERLEMWDKVLIRISKFFTPELLKLK
jgi:phosphatidylserine/phosphatidylglycerophosphate/cardiolipin synthase-like enzyme